MMKYDVIIVGAGVAGLYCALHLPKHLKVLVICKEEPWECNTFYAQGGISVARDTQDLQSHIQDTLNAGSAMNNLESVKLLCQESLKVIEDLQRLGLKIDTDENNQILYAKEGGHQSARIIHFDGDGTGRVLHTRLIASLPHLLWKKANVVDLLIEDSHCYGVCLQNNQEIFQIYANYVVLASGGIGGLYQYHTNARTISGELHGMILEHHLPLADMEMVQFHPTVFTQAPIARKPLISEAVRGEGGKIIDENGRRFLFDYDERGELAPRDIVARGIFDYCQKNQQKAYLDVSHFDLQGFVKRFPSIYNSLSSFGLDLPKQKIPISPAFHYCMGGIKVDSNSRVLGMENLYAIGECANTGVHGANRLASNSLLEGLVFGKKVAQTILNQDFPQLSKRIFPLIQENLKEDGDTQMKARLREIMWEKVGIVRNVEGLHLALGAVEAMLNTKCGRILRLRLLCAREVILHAMRRKESLGAHYLES